MPDTLVLPDASSGRADALPPPFGCSRKDGGLDSSGAHAIVCARQVARRRVVLRGRPNVDRVCTLSGTVDDLGIYDRDPAEPPVQVFL
jgi:hypothetical protein